jgi:uncharacterized repeat protein (TIGR01451 family)
VTPGQTLYVEVGGAGQPGPCDETNTATNAFNGGGQSQCGGGGGGGSDVRTCSMATCDLTGNDTRLVVAGGGGGGGGSFEDSGGAGGQAGDSTVAGAGAGGTACDVCNGVVGQAGFNGGFGHPPGAGGGASTFDGYSCTGDPGTVGRGGDAEFSCVENFNAGAGGGGYDGGGAGGAGEQAVGGGAGSSFWETSAVATSMTEDTTGTPQIVITPDTVVTVTKSATTTTPVVGTNDTFSLTATDVGPANAGQVVVTDPIPAGLTIVSALAPTGSDTPVVSGQTVTWTIPSLNASGPFSSLTEQITVTVKTSAPVTNTATFTQANPNLTGGTTGSSNSLTLTPEYAVVTVVKTATSTTPSITTAGASDAFTLTAANAGPNDSGKVVVTDALPAGLVYVSSSASTGTIGVVGQTVTWTITNLTASGPGSTATAQIVVNITTPAATTNTATFTQTTPNGTGGTTGSSGSVTTTASCAAGQTTYHLTATSNTGNFTGTFCVNAAGSGAYLQSGGAHGTGSVVTSGTVTRINAFGTNLALIGQKSGTTSSFTETAPAPVKAGTFSLA